MLRRGAQFAITRHLQDLKTNDKIVSFFKVLGNELELNDINSFLIKIFLNIKHRLKDESLDIILQWLQENGTSSISNSSISLGTLCQKEKELELECQVKRIPDDILYHIGSNLSKIDMIKLSQTNHWFHKKIHDESFLHKSNNGIENVLILSEKQMSCICEMGTKSSNYGNLLSCNKIKIDKLAIGDEIEKKINCNKYNKCSFCRIISQIEEKNNYDLQWFVNILSNVECVHFSNNWPCLWNKMALQWLLKTSPNKQRVDILNNIATTGEIYAGNPLKIIASTDGNDINRENGRAFANCYESYFIKQCESDLNKIREIGSIYFGSSVDYCIKKMNQNYKSLFFAHDNRFKCQTLSQFIKIFHENVFNISATITQQTKFAKLFFDSSSNIYKDLMKNESILSLESFKSKYYINHDTISNILPYIPFLHIAMYSFPGDKNPHKKLLRLFQNWNENSKLMSILNFHESVRFLSVQIGEQAVGTFDKDYHSLIDIFTPIFDNFNKIMHIDVEYMSMATGEEQFNVVKSSIELFFERIEAFFKKLYFEPILYKILYNLKTNPDGTIKNFRGITIGLNHKHCAQNEKYEITQTIMIDDIKPPFVHSCKQRSNMVTKQILKKIQDEKDRRIKSASYNEKSIELVVEFETQHNL